MSIPLDPQQRAFAQALGMLIAAAVWNEIAAGAVPAVEDQDLEMRRAPGRQDRERDANTRNDHESKHHPAA